LATSDPIATTAMADRQRSRLRRVLGRFDLILLSVSAVLGVDTVASSAGLGGYQFITWLVLSAVFFLLPYGLITAELAAAFPREGGLFVWVRESHGPYLGAIVSFMYWISNPIWMGSLAFSAVSTLETAFGWNPDTAVGLGLALAFVWLATFLEIFYLNAAKWLPNVGGLIKVSLMLLLLGAAVAFVARHGVANPVTLKAFVPTGGTTIALMGVLIFDWVGFEVQSAASEEMRDPRRDVPRAILSAGAMGAVAYTAGVLAILFVTPLKDVSNVTGLFGAFQAVFHSPALLAVLALAICVGYVSSGTAWLIGVDRSFAASGWERTVPRQLGHFHPQYGTPDRVALLSGVTGSVALLLSYLSSHQVGITGVYNNILNAAFVAALVPYLFMLPAALVLRRKYPQVQRPFRVPGGQAGLWVATTLSFAFVLASVVAAFVPNRYTGVTASGSLFQLYVLAGEVAVATALFVWAQRQAPAAEDESAPPASVATAGGDTP
jgi:amino acid transporter